MQNIKTICLLSLFLSILQSTQTQITTQSIYDAEIEKKVKLIPENHINIINMIFTKVPLYTLKTQGAYKKAQQILKQLDFKTEEEIKAFNTKYNSEEKIKALIFHYQEEIIKPVKELFPLLHLKEYRFINEPLFINILVEEKTQNEIKLKTKKQDVSLEDVYNHIDEKDIPIGLKFLKADTKVAQTFFKDFIIDKETLIICCKEFDIIFGPLNKILTQDTKNKAVKYYKELIYKKRQK